MGFIRWCKNYSSKFIFLYFSLYVIFSEFYRITGFQNFLRQWIPLFNLIQTICKLFGQLRLSALFLAKRVADIWQKLDKPVPVYGKNKAKTRSWPNNLHTVWIRLKRGIHCRKKFWNPVILQNTEKIPYKKKFWKMNSEQQFLHHLIKLI